LRKGWGKTRLSGVIIGKKNRSGGAKSGEKQVGGINLGRKVRVWRKYWDQNGRNDWEILRKDEEGKNVSRGVKNWLG